MIDYTLNKQSKLLQKDRYTDTRQETEMTELLAPAGNMEALKAAVCGGCNAVYLGLTKFGARAYSDNFDTDSLAEAVSYAHLRDVKIYVTMNTIVFESEISDMRTQLSSGTISAWMA